MNSLFIYIFKIVLVYCRIHPSSAPYSPLPLSSSTYICSSLIPDLFCTWSPLQTCSIVNKHNYHNNCHLRVFNPQCCGSSAQAISKWGEGKTYDRDWDRMWGPWYVDTLLIQFKPSSSTGIQWTCHQLVGIGWLPYSWLKCHMISGIIHQIRGGKHLTLESAWPPNHLQQSDCLHFMFNLEELCPGFLWLCPAEKEGLCLDDDYCRTFRGWYPIWSVPWGNRGRKPVIYEGPFWEGTHWTSQKDCGTDARERWPPDTPKEA